MAVPTCYVTALVFVWLLCGTPDALKREKSALYIQLQ